MLNWSLNLFAFEIREGICVCRFVTWIEVQFYLQHFRNRCRTYDSTVKQQPSGQWECLNSVFQRSMLHWWMYEQFKLTNFSQTAISIRNKYIYFFIRIILATYRSYNINAV